MNAPDYTIDTACTAFFDRDAVLKHFDRQTLRVMSRFGAFVRRRARSSIRARRRAAPPGQPPSSHTGLLKRHIYFLADVARKSVVIGPVRLAGRSNGDAPRALEHGATIQVTRRRRSGREYTTRATYQPRPFMRPAFDEELKQLPQTWGGAIS